MNSLVPTPELIEKAKADYLLAAAARSPGMVSLAEARELAGPFADTLDIRTVELPGYDADLLAATAAFNKRNAPEALVIAIQKMFLVRPRLIQVAISELPSIKENAEQRRFQLQPDIFVPLAECAIQHWVPSSTLARVAVQQNFQL